MVGRVRAEFRVRLEKNHWLTAATRKQALDKLDKVKITVGYPDQWIDYSSVDVRPGDYFGSLERITEFSSRRDLARFGGPIREDEFVDPRSTLPTVINAGYNSLRNSIEIPAPSCNRRPMTRRAIRRPISVPSVPSSAMN
ncbi:MAG: hypothetical protein IPK44_00560 [Candidatus Accumulibacter sp.]|nr:hypothetical protein [Accumulibacter sp.]